MSLDARDSSKQMAPSVDPRQRIVGMAAPRAPRRRVLRGVRRGEVADDTDVPAPKWDDVTERIEQDADWLTQTERRSAPGSGAGAPPVEPSCKGAPHDTIVEVRPPVLVMNDATDTMVPWPGSIVAARVVAIEEDSVIIGATGERVEKTAPSAQPATPPVGQSSDHEAQRVYAEVRASSSESSAAVTPTVVDAARVAPPAVGYPPSAGAPEEDALPVSAAWVSTAPQVASPQLPAIGPMRPAPMVSVPPMLVDPPLTIPRRRAWPVVLAASLACAALVALWLFWPRPGTLVVRLRTTEGAPVPNAAIYVDGRRVCEAEPCRLVDLDPGERQVEAVVAGRPSASASVTVTAGEVAEIWLEVPFSQRLTADSAVSGARIQIDGIDRGPLPAALDDLEPGRHAVTVTAPGHRPFQRTIELRAGETHDLGLIPLEAAPATLTLELATAGAHVVLIDARKHERVLTGPWPLTLDLEPGAYDLRASRDGFKPFRRHLDIRGEHPPTLTIALDRAEPETSARLEPDPRRDRGEAPESDAPAKADLEAGVEDDIQNPYVDRL